MNKLILVGNGFDLAHGLPTSYKDFIDDFWINIHLNYKKDSYKSFVYINNNYFRILNYHKEVNNFKDFEENLIKYQNEYNQEVDGYRDYELKTRDSKCKIFHFTNNLFKQINSKYSIENWVDIENEYFSELKKITKLSFGGFDEEKTKATRKDKVVLLNKEFEQIKNLFEKYLSENVLPKFDFKTPEDWNKFWQLSEILKPFIVSKEQHFVEKIENLKKEFSFKVDKDEIEAYKTIDSKNNFEREVFQSVFLSFNYTPTMSEYLKYINKNYETENCILNFIHGEIKSEENKINFGFGDEMDDYYKEIENIGDNEYLKNFKSFQYSNTTNYDDLLRYIDSDKYQVSILGHSCGLSDRLLLNTIFEHENCRSIKIYYHQKEDGSDNYTDMVQNISRHFKDKQSMRRKIVNKTLSSPLPQNVRFKKKE